jgi:hypothetical protein
MNWKLRLYQLRLFSFEEQENLIYKHASDCSSRNYWDLIRNLASLDLENKCVTIWQSGTLSDNWSMFFLLFLYWGYIVTFTEVLTIYHSCIHLYIILLYPSCPIPGIVSTGLIFPFIYICRHYLYHIHPLIHFPHILHPSTGTNPKERTCSPRLFFVFVKK